MQELTNSIEELYLVKSKNSLFKKFKVTSSFEAYDFIKKVYKGSIEVFESFYAVFLNNSNEITSFSKVSQGGITSTVIDVRLLSCLALKSLSVGVILVHNHPSGKLSPSTSDIQVTKKVKNTLSMFDVKVLDHLIVSSEGYFSFADKGVL